jgi:hypothetical protein
MIRAMDIEARNNGGKSNQRPEGEETVHAKNSARERLSPLAMISEEFKAMRYRLIDHIANFLDSLPGRPVTPAGSPVTIREALQAVYDRCRSPAKNRRYYSTAAPPCT